MDYSSPIVTSHHFAGITPAAAAVTRYIPIPKGATSARVVEIGVAVAVVMTGGATTPPMVNVGVAGDLDKFASLKYGAPGVPAAANSIWGGRTAAVNYPLFQAVWNKATDDVNFLTVTFAPPAAVGTTGTIDANVHVAWDYALT